MKTEGKYVFFQSHYNKRVFPFYVLSQKGVIHSASLFLKLKQHKKAF